MHDGKHVGVEDTSRFGDVDVEGWDRVVDAGVVDEHIETKTVGLGLDRVQAGLDGG